ncbi:hypothetical protein C8F01DRAFT_1258535 [Mycena amicta]|nr:hypothetical protein C8F01DRAFT_1258535 [Mycena amicta]
MSVLRISLQKSAPTRPLHAAMVSALLLDAILAFGLEDPAYYTEEDIETYLDPPSPGADPAAGRPLNVFKVLGPPTSDTKQPSRSTRVELAVHASNLAAMVQESLNSIDHVEENLAEARRRAKDKSGFVPPATESEIKSSVYVAGFLRHKGKTVDLGNRRHFNLVHLVLVANLLCKGFDITNPEDIKKGLKEYHRALGLTLSFGDDIETVSVAGKREEIVVDLDITGPLALCLGTTFVGILNDERKFSTRVLATSVCVFDLHKATEFRSTPKSLVWKLERIIFAYALKSITGQFHPAMFMPRLQKDPTFTNLKTVLQALLHEDRLSTEERDAWYLLLSDLPQHENRSIPSAHTSSRPGSMNGEKSLGNGQYSHMQRQEATLTSSDQGQLTADKSRHSSPLSPPPMDVDADVDDPDQAMLKRKRTEELNSEEESAGEGQDKAPTKPDKKKPKSKARPKSKPRPRPKQKPTLNPISEADSNNGEDIYVEVAGLRFLPTKHSFHMDGSSSVFAVYAMRPLADEFVESQEARQLKEQYVDKTRRRLENTTVKLSSKTVEMQLYAPNDKHDMSSSFSYTWQPEGDTMADIIKHQPTAVENGIQKPLHMLESARDLRFVGDGSQSELCVMSYQDFMLIRAQVIGEILANRSILLYDCPSEGDCPSEDEQDFAACIKYVRSPEALVEIQDGYLPQDGAKGIVIDQLKKLIPDPDFCGGKPRANALQNLTPNHPVVAVPRINTWGIHIRGLTHTADIPELRAASLPTQHLQWAIFGNDGVYTGDHVDASGFTVVQVLNKKGGKAWAVQNSNILGPKADGKQGAYYSRHMYEGWNGGTSNTNLYASEVLWLHHKMMLIMRPMTAHRVVGLGDTGTGGLHGHELQTIDRSIAAEIHGVFASEISTNTDHSDARWLFTRILILQLNSMLRGEQSHHVLVLTDGIQLEKFVLLVTFNVVLPSLQKSAYCNIQQGGRYKGALPIQLDRYEELEYAWKRIGIFVEHIDTSGVFCCETGAFKTFRQAIDDAILQMALCCYKYRQNTNPVAAAALNKVQFTVATFKTQLVKVLSAFDHVRYLAQQPTLRPSPASSISAYQPVYKSPALGSDTVSLTHLHLPDTALDCRLSLGEMLGLIIHANTPPLGGRLLGPGAPSWTTTPSKASVRLPTANTLSPAQPGSGLTKVPIFLWTFYDVTERNVVGCPNTLESTKHFHHEQLPYSKEPSSSMRTEGCSVLDLVYVHITSDDLDMLDVEASGAIFFDRFFFGLGAGSRSFRFSAICSLRAGHAL